MEGNLHKKFKDAEHFFWRIPFHPLPSPSVPQGPTTPPQGSLAVPRAVFYFRAQTAFSPGVTAPDPCLQTLHSALRIGGWIQGLGFSSAEFRPNPSEFLKSLCLALFLGTSPLNPGWRALPPARLVWPWWGRRDVPLKKALLKEDAVAPFEVHLVRYGSCLHLRTFKLPALSLPPWSAELKVALSRLFFSAKR